MNATDDPYENQETFGDKNMFHDTKPQPEPVPVPENNH